MALVPSYIQRLGNYKPGKPIAEAQRELGIQNFIKLASNEKLSSDDMEKIKTLQNELETFIDKRTMKNKLDLKYLRTETQEK